MSAHPVPGALVCQIRLHSRAGRRAHESGLPYACTHKKAQPAGSRLRGGIESLFRCGVFDHQVLVLNSEKSEALAIKACKCSPQIGTVSRLIPP